MNDAPTAGRGGRGAAKQAPCIRTLVIGACGEGDRLPRLSDTQAAQWRDAYNGMVEHLAGHFGRESDWWFVPLSSRDHLTSPMQAHFQQAARLELAMDQADCLRLCAVCDDGLLASSLADLASAHGWRVRRSLSDRFIWAARDLSRRVQNAAALVSRNLWLFRYWRIGRKHGLWRTQTSGLDAIIVAPLHLPLKHDEQGQVLDTYFGSLPAILTEGGERVAVTGPTLCDPREHAALCRELKPAPVIALESMITASDAVSLLWRNLKCWIAPPAPPPNMQGPMPRLSHLVSREIADTVYTRAQGGHLERSFANLLARSPKARVIHTFENNFWERAIDRPAAALRPPRSTLGYLHCNVLGSHLKNLYRKSEEACRPAPQRIICTGPSARDVLLSLGEYDPESVSPGCALRGPDLAGLSLREDGPRPIRNVLVLMEGLPNIPHFLRFVADGLPFLGDRRIVVRAHPVFPVEAVARAAGVDLAPKSRLEPSTNDNLIADIENADAVIFKASSTALIAGYIGCPLIHYRDNWWLEDNPLRDCEDMQFTVSRPEEFELALSHFESMSASCMRSERKALRGYLEKYLAEPTPKALAPFMS